jgi:hypothetical protein
MTVPSSPYIFCPSLGNHDAGYHRCSPCHNEFCTKVTRFANIERCFQISTFVGKAFSCVPDWKWVYGRVDTICLVSQRLQSESLFSALRQHNSPISNHIFKYESPNCVLTTSIPVYKYMDCAPGSLTIRSDWL